MSEQYNIIGPDNGGKTSLMPLQNSQQYIQVFDPQNTFNANAEDEKDTLDIKYLLSILFRRKFQIILFALLGIAAAFAYVQNAEPLYRAKAKIEVQAQESQIIDDGSMNPALKADAEFLATQYALLKSRTLAERVVISLGLDKREGFSDPALNAESRIKQATEVVLGSLNAGPEGRSRIINVNYTSPDPKLAADITNAIVDSFIQTTLERKFNTTAYARAFVDERLAQAKVNLEESERELVAYADENDILLLQDAGERTSLTNNKILRLSQDLAEAQTERIIIEQKFLELNAGGSTAEILDSEDLKRLRARRSDLNSEYLELLTLFQPDYPEARLLKERLDALNTEIELETKAILDASKAALNAARARENILLRNIEAEKNELRGLRNRSVDYTILQREVDTARLQYDALLQRMKEVSVAAGVGSSQISFVDRAVPPDYAFSPRKPLILFMGLLAGSGFGVLLALALFYLDDTVKTPEDIKARLNIPLIGVVPKVKVDGDDTSSVTLRSLQDPKSVISEAYFSARTALEYSSDGGVPSSILVTSNQPSEGKTSTAVALAVSFARIGQKVLIIDADMRKPSFVADLEKSIGLSGMLSKESNLDDNIMNIPGTDLYLLPCGVIPPNPAELLSGTRIKKLISQAEEKFDLVIVDSPPLLSFTDAPALGSVCKGAVIVIKSGKIRTPAAKQTLERLRFNKATILGGILTHFDAKKSGYNYDYYYAYGGGSGKYGEDEKTRKSIESKSRKINLFGELGPDAS